MTKNSPTRQQQLEKELSDSLADNPFVRWITNNSKNLLTGVAALFLLAFISFWFLGKSGGSVKNFLDADQYFLTFAKAKDPKEQMEALGNLDALINRIPSLQSKYDAQLSQILLDRQEIEKATFYGNRVLSRTKQDALPFFADYATNSFTISEQNYDAAFEKAGALQKQLIDQTYPTLNAYNLLRIAILQQQLGHKNEELLAWQAFKPQAVFTGLDTGKASLLNYVDFRQNELKWFEKETKKEQLQERK